MQLQGFHHLTAITADAPANLAFYTGVLGLRLVKKTVNQDDVSSYHLFYADGNATPGTDVTFFDWPAVRERRGSASIARTGFRVAGEQSLRYWADRLRSLEIPHQGIVERDGGLALDFEDPEGQRLGLVTDSPAAPASRPWEKSPVPPEYQLRGLGAITLSVHAIDPTHSVLTQLMLMRPQRKYTAGRTDGSAGETVVHVYAMADGGPSAELHLAIEPSLPPARLGAGGVHHVAFRIPTFDEYDEWHHRLQEATTIRSSGPVDRFYFRSLYFREPGGILFELATDGPGFTADEPLDQLGQRLALPPFLEPRRAQIEAGLKTL